MRLTITKGCAILCQTIVICKICRRFKLCMYLETFSYQHIHLFTITKHLLSPTLFCFGNIKTSQPIMKLQHCDAFTSLENSEVCFVQNFHCYVTMISPHRCIFDETSESPFLDLDRLSLPIVESQNKMEEVTFPQVPWWLLFKVSSVQRNAGKHR